MKKITLKTVFTLFIFILIPQLAGFVGSIFTIGAIPTWYQTLTRPVIAPPNWVFAPVWTTLFTMMGISAFLVFQKGMQSKQVHKALIIFAIHLVLNTSWSIIFFGFQMLWLAFAEILVLLGFIMYMTVLFYKVNKLSAYLLIPYIFWVSFASILNLAFAMLN